VQDIREGTRVACICTTLAAGTRDSEGSTVAGMEAVSSWLAEGRRGEVEAIWGTVVPVQEVAPCAGDEILVETLRRVRRIIMEKRQRSPLPENDLDSRPRLAPPGQIERPAHKSLGGGKGRFHDQRVVVVLLVAMLLEKASRIYTCKPQRH
jgi:hypothetical protein